MNKDALNQKFVSACRTRKTEQARALFATIFANGFTVDSHYHFLAQSYMPKNVPEAIQLVEEGLKQFPDSKLLIHFKAHCLLAGHRSDELVEWGMKYKFLAPDMVSMLIDALTRLQRFGNAMKLCEEAAQQYPKDIKYFKRHYARLIERQNSRLAYAGDEIFTITINLEERADNREKCLANYQQMGVNLKKHTWLKATKRELGMIGCAHSHARALLEYLATSSAPYVLVLEDDVDLLEPMANIQNYLQEMKADGGFDVLMLYGGEPLLGMYGGKRFQRTFASASTTGYIVTRHYAHNLVESHINAATTMEAMYRKGMSDEQINFVGVIDQRWRNMQSRDRWFIAAPPLLHVREGFSNIQNKVTAPKQYPRFHWPQSSPFHPDNIKN